MRVLLCALAGVLVLAAPAVAKPPAGEWLAGDLHVHTCFSHDVWCGPDDDNTGIEDANTLGHSVGDDFLLAGLRGLDYLAITDHNDIRSQSDPGFGADGVIGVPGYEKSLHGHAQMLGATHVFDAGDQSTAAVSAMADALRADGGVFQANHPSDPVWEYGYDVPVDDVEVWNLPRFYQSPAPSTSDNDNDNATRYWQGWLDRGAHVTATGGSDSHWRATDAQQGPGNPTTWVYSGSRTARGILNRLFFLWRRARGILNGLRRGRTFITWQPPAFQPPRLLLEAGNGHMVGDTVRETAPFR